MLPDLQRGKAFGPDRAMETLRTSKQKIYIYPCCKSQTMFLFWLHQLTSALHNITVLREVACLLTPKSLQSSFKAKIQKECLKFKKILEALQLQEYIESCLEAFSPK